MLAIAVIYSRGRSRIDLEFSSYLPPAPSGIVHASVRPGWFLGASLRLPDHGLLLLHGRIFRATMTPRNLTMAFDGGRGDGRRVVVDVDESSMPAPLFTAPRRTHHQAPLMAKQHLSLHPGTCTDTSTLSRPPTGGAEDRMALVPGACRHVLSRLAASLCRPPAVRSRPAPMSA